MLPSFIHLGANGLLSRGVSGRVRSLVVRPARWRVSRFTLRVARTEFIAQDHRNSADRDREEGLLSEDYETSNFRMWGNFPQAYSHAGLIQAAFATSPRWAEVL
jgi:hypothetical protein